RGRVQAAGPDRITVRRVDLCLPAHREARRDARAEIHPAVAAVVDARLDAKVEVLVILAHGVQVAARAGADQVAPLDLPAARLVGGLLPPGQVLAVEQLHDPARRQSPHLDLANPDRAAVLLDPDPPRRSAHARKNLRLPGDLLQVELLHLVAV